MADQDRTEDADGDQSESRSTPETRNELSMATLSGVMVQAGSISGGVHHHLPPRKTPTPRQLPAAPPHFVGRADELALLTSALDNSTEAGGTVLISALAGAGGIGKTALALHWAHANLHRFPDGQLFVDLQGFSSAGAPLDRAVAVRGFLDAFGVDPGRIPADLDAQAARYRSLVAGRRMLIVLDNAADVAQVRPLLPGTSSCTVLVTSRKQLTSLITHFGARHIRVGVLTETDARQALTARLGADRVNAQLAATEQLLAYCAGLPLALAIVAGRAHTSPDTPLIELTHELIDEATRIGGLDDEDPAASLPAVLSWSYRALTANQRTVFGLVGIAPGPDICLDAAASLIGITPHKVRTVLHALADVSLLDRHSGGRYAMHDLVRAYSSTTAYQYLEDNERQPAMRRIVDYYTHTAQIANRLLQPHRTPIRLDPPAPNTCPTQLPNFPAAMVWFDAEHPNLLAAQNTAADHGWHLTAWQLAWTLDTYHDRRGRRHDRLTVWRGALDAAAHLLDPTTVIYAHRALGIAYAQMGRHADATDHLHRALAVAEQHRDRTQQVRTHQILARAWGLRGNDRRALEHAIQALDVVTREVVDGVSA